MNNRSVELLRKLFSFIENIDQASDMETKQIAQDYFDLSESEKVFFINLLNETLNDMKPLLLQFLTLFSGGENNSYSMSLMGKTALEANLDTGELLKFFIQYRYLSFVSSSSLREELIDLYVSICDKCSSLLPHQYNYIKYEKRNKNKVMLIADQILGERHAPTQILANQWYYLKQAGYEVDVLVICESKITTPDFWMGPYVLMNNLPMPEGRFALECYGQKIEGTNIFLEADNLGDSISKAIDTIVTYNPAFIISIGEMNLIPDIASSFTTVVTKTTTKNIPFTLSKYVMYRDIVESDGLEKNMRNDIVVLQDYFVNVLAPQEDGDNDYTEMLRNDSRFKVLIVGNRLDHELGRDFLDTLNNLADDYVDFVFVVIGKCDKFKLLVQESGYMNHYIFTGYVNNLSAITKECDVFLNPPREGGGFSAEIALKNGVPVITLGDCDVAEWAGSEYICDNIGSMIEDIKKCYNDSTYVKERSQKAIERWKSRVLSEQKGIDNTKSFCAELVECIKKDELL